jgi:CPA2 family monovalent cation:H+ antiporter-2
MEATLLRDVVVILGLALAVVYVGQKFGVPTLIGLFLTGLLAGPAGLQLVRGLHEVEVIAEIGVVLLLFTIGLELSLSSILRAGRRLLVSGTVQLLVVLVMTIVAARMLGEPWNTTVLLGLILSASSTAIALRLIQQRGDLDAPYGQASLGILVYQDLMIVPVMLLLPLLAGTGEALAPALGVFLLKGAGAVGFLLVAARFVVPRLLEAVVQTQSRELFVITVIAICLAVAWLASVLELPLALGAFLAGLTVSESEYSHQAIADVLPFRELFTAFFFVSIGMLLEPDVLLEQPLLSLVAVVGVISVKMLAGSAAAVALGLPLRSVLLTAVALGQVGEFSFVIAEGGFRLGLIGQARYQWFLAAAVLSMAATPFLLPLAHKLAERIPAGRRLWGTGPPGDLAVPIDARSLRDHVVIIGYGMNGRNVATACRLAGIDHVVIELNPDHVRTVRELGGRACYGDATQLPVLQQAAVQRARVVIVAISDASTTRRTAKLIRSLSPAGHLIVRTRYVRETEPLVELGAEHVVPEELETSIEIVSLMLTHYLIPRAEIATFVSRIRADSYAMLRTPSQPRTALDELNVSLPEVEIATLRAQAGSPLVGRTLRESDLRQLYGVTVVAQRRGESLQPNPSGDARIEEGDVLLLLGMPEEIQCVQELLGPAPPE